MENQFNNVQEEQENEDNGSDGQQPGNRRASNMQNQTFDQGRHMQTRTLEQIDDDSENLKEEDEFHESNNYQLYDKNNKLKIMRNTAGSNGQGFYQKK